jgi:hypothetical protein
LASHSVPCSASMLPGDLARRGGQLSPFGGIERCGVRPRDGFSERIQR